MIAFDKESYPDFVGEDFGDAGVVVAVVSDSLWLLLYAEAVVVGCVGAVIAAVGADPAVVATLSLGTGMAWAAQADGDAAAGAPRIETTGWPCAFQIVVW
jgi:hypothetical protein